MDKFNASDDLKAIRSVIGRRNSSMGTFGLVFVIWGIVFLVASAIANIVDWQLYAQYFTENPVMNYILSPFVIASVLAAIVFFAVTHKHPFNSLEKRLMALWVCVISAAVLISAVPVEIVVSGSFLKEPLHDLMIRQSMITSSSSAVIFVFALGFCFMSVLTSQKHKIIIAAYVALGVLCFFFQPLNDLVKTVVWPVTFLYLGIYLLILKKRSVSNEAE